MVDLIAIGYPDETTATAAADEAQRLAQDLIIQPDAIAVIVRDKDGSTTSTLTRTGHARPPGPLAACRRAARVWPGHDQVLFGRDGVKGTRLAFSRKRMTVGMVSLL